MRLCRLNVRKGYVGFRPVRDEMFIDPKTSMIFLAPSGARCL